MKVRVTDDVCVTCKYYSTFTETCDYSLINHSSRLYTNGVRIEDGFCDKYIAGKREYDGHDWKNGELR